MQYKVKMKSDDFFKLHSKLKTYNMEIESNYVIFDLDIDNFKILKESKYNYELIDSMNNKAKKFIYKHYIVFIGLLYVFAIMYIDSFRVSNIVFNNNTPINDDIETYIESKYKKFLIYNYINVDYKDLSNQIRQAYSSYPYINVYKKDDEIKVEIYNYNDKISEEEYYNVIGDVVATKDSIVDQFYVYNGTLNIYKNKYVKKGDILIDSKLGNNVYVSARGLIYGYTYERIKLIVDKKEEVFSYTKREDDYYKISIFSYNFNIGKDNDYNAYDEISDEKFSLFGFFSIKKIVDKEKSVIIKTYEKEESISIANKIIENNFEVNKTNDLEKIVDRYIYSVKENETSYEIEIVVKMYESIGVFKER